MRILVFSDTHNDASYMGKAVSLYKPQHVFHLGDGLRDMEKLFAVYPSTVFAGVRGNNDFLGNYPTSLEMEIEGYRFFLSHGHTFGVKHGDTRFYETAKSKGADIALCGHTHIAEYEIRDSVHLMNPGSASYIMSAGRPTAGLITISENAISARIIRI